MKAEPLQIRDKRFLINRLIQQAPKSTLVREFFKNADEMLRKESLKTVTSKFILR
jgi:hypothetical protein